jgi:hypothetical protein
MRCIHAIAAGFEGRPRCVERLRRPGQVARDECDFGLGDNTPCACHRFLPAEGARRTSQQSLRSNEIAELRHRDASQRQGGRIVTQGNSLECANGITPRKCTRRRRD